MTASPDSKMKILLAAKKMFAEQGFDATSVRQICEEAGVNLALVSYHFGGKENVFYAIFEQFFPLEKLDMLEQETLDPVQGLRLVVTQTLLFFDQEPELHRIMEREFSGLSPRAEKLTRFTFPVWHKVRAILEEGRRKELFQFDSLDYALLLVLSALIFPKKRSFLYRLNTEGPYPIDQIIHFTWQFVYGGLRAK
ncbi:TetR/AcrR family transcriptional regulator [Xylanibacillus composti]|uniref:TetR family transcriptional regulator n=1 Tax=Xylanibacillus composti TaxID=1572762 RepID=A0A8J4H7Q1_9BACL|nr:TetR family transcriptional regulator [Xylanibacillus composti]GIQ71425.1 TetR family transcriptional regulator [Xylanibacillus composti]